MTADFLDSTFKDEDLTRPTGSKRWSDPPAAGIKIAAGETKRMYAGSELHIEFLEIEAGGTLLVKNGRRTFTYIRVQKYLLNHGTIEFSGFRSGGGSFSETAPDGELLDVYLEEVNRGGDGGNGSAIKCHYGGIGRGGRGARGTPDWGGGGGGGVGWSKQIRGKCVPGGDASDWTGARGKAPFPGGDGGEGARRGRAVNGGYLYLKSDGWIESPGLLDFRGSSGDDGHDGETMSALGTGGGGGGAPGGQGGVLYLNCRDIRGQINFNGSGGAGGKPGKGAFAYGNQADDGKPGEAGYDGELIVL